jgi:hypothetical protein
MWNSSVIREQILQKISLLAILESVRDHPKQHTLISPPGRRSSLTIEQEREIVSNLAFLSSRSKNSKRVVAIGIEEDHDGQGMVIRLAVNGGDKDISHTEEGLKQISILLEQASRRGKVQSVDLLLLLIFNRATRGRGHNNATSACRHRGFSSDF